MNSNDIRKDQNHLPTQSEPTYRLWARLGVSLEVSEETRDRIAAGDKTALEAVLLGKEGKAHLDGETYFPCDAPENRLMKEDVDFDFFRTPLHETTTQMAYKEIPAQRPDPAQCREDRPQSFYYTFGTSDSFPYKKGWVEVKAANRTQADFLFRMRYPDRTPGVLNCSSIYDEEGFRNLARTLSDHPDWRVCHDVIGLMPPQQRAHEATSEYLASTNSLSEKVSEAQTRAAAQDTRDNTPPQKITGKGRD